MQTIKNDETVKKKGRGSQNPLCWMLGLLALVLKKRNAHKPLRQIILDVMTWHNNA